MTYFKTQEEMETEAKTFLNGTTYLLKTKTKCDCGESSCFIVRTIDQKEDLFEGVECEDCFNQYE